MIMTALPELEQNLVLDVEQPPENLPAYFESVRSWQGAHQMAQ